MSQILSYIFHQYNIMWLNLANVMLSLYSLGHIRILRLITLKGCKVVWLKGCKAAGHLEFYDVDSNALKGYDKKIKPILEQKVRYKRNQGDLLAVT